MREIRIIPAGVDAALRGAGVGLGVAGGVALMSSWVRSCSGGGWNCLGRALTVLMLLPSAMIILGWVLGALLRVRLASVVALVGPVAAWEVLAITGLIGQTSRAVPALLALCPVVYAAAAWGCAERTPRTVRVTAGALFVVALLVAIASVRT